MLLQRFCFDVLELGFENVLRHDTAGWLPLFMCPEEVYFIHQAEGDINKINMSLRELYKTKFRIIRKLSCPFPTFPLLRNLFHVYCGIENLFLSQQRGEFRSTNIKRKFRMQTKRQVLCLKSKFTRRNRGQFFYLRSRTTSTIIRLNLLPLLRNCLELSPS
jgi:hypothetical protein